MHDAWLGNSHERYARQPEGGGVDTLPFMDQMESHTGGADVTSKPRAMTGGGGGGIAIPVNNAGGGEGGDGGGEGNTTCEQWIDRLKWLELQSQRLLFWGQDSLKAIQIKKRTHSKFLLDRES